MGLCPLPSEPSEDESSVRTSFAKVESISIVYLVYPLSAVGFLCTVHGFCCCAWFLRGGVWGLMAAFLSQTPLHGAAAELIEAVTRRSTSAGTCGLLAAVLRLRLPSTSR